MIRKTPKNHYAKTAIMYEDNNCCAKLLLLLTRKWTRKTHLQLGRNNILDCCYYQTHENKIIDNEEAENGTYTAVAAARMNLFSLDKNYSENQWYLTAIRVILLFSTYTPCTFTWKKTYIFLFWVFVKNLFIIRVYRTPAKKFIIEFKKKNYFMRLYYAYYSAKNY